MNHVVLTGRLTRDPELRKLASGKTVTQFNVATNDYRGGSEKAEYHTVVTWDRLAEMCVRQLLPSCIRTQHVTGVRPRRSLGEVPLPA